MILSSFTVYALLLGILAFDKFPYNHFQSYVLLLGVACIANFCFLPAPQRAWWTTNDLTLSLTSIGLHYLQYLALATICTSWLFQSAIAIFITPSLANLCIQALLVWNEYGFITMDSSFNILALLALRDGGLVPRLYERFSGHPWPLHYSNHGRVDTLFDELLVTDRSQRLGYAIENGRAWMKRHQARVSHLTAEYWSGRISNWQALQALLGHGTDPSNPQAEQGQNTDLAILDVAPISSGANATRRRRSKRE